ncbi:hypothetical protein ACLB1M_35095 [Escherichia coli]
MSVALGAIVLAGYLSVAQWTSQAKQDREMNIGNRFISGLRDGSAATDACYR